MDQNRNHGKKCSVFKKIKYFLTPQVRLDARLLDFMQDHPEITPDSEPIEAPPDEFQKIIAEMNRRGIKPAVRRQLAIKRCFRQAGRYMQKPAFVAFLVVLILGGTSVGVSAKKAYDYRMREREVGKSDIVWNNDEYVIVEEDKINAVHDAIAQKLEIKPIKLNKLPFGMKFYDSKIEDGIATIQYLYKDRIFCLIEAKYSVAASSNLVSDRESYKTIDNHWLNEEIKIEKNELSDGNIEYGAGLTIKGTYYYLSGILSEEDFIDIITNLSF